MQMKKGERASFRSSGSAAHQQGKPVVVGGPRFISESTPGGNTNKDETHSPPIDCGPGRAVSGRNIASPLAAYKPMVSSVGCLVWPIFPPSFRK